MPDFLTDLSTGIFGRMEQLRREQMDRDAQAQRNTISVLGDLYSKVRPESQAVILDQLGKAIGVKGKMKTFWEAFSGMPNRSVEDQLGTQLRELSSMSISPQQAKQIESKADISRLFGGGSPLSKMFQQPGATLSPQGRAKQEAIDAEKGLAGKLIFRDPRQERLDEIEQRYAAQTQAALEKSAVDKALANRYQMERDAANRKGRIDLAFTNQILNAQRPQLRIAYQLWHRDYLAGATPTEPDPTQIPPQQYMAAAAAEIAKDTQLGRRKTEAQIGALNRQGEPGGKPLTQSQQAQIDQEIRNEAQKIITAVSGNKQIRNTAAAKRDALLKQLDDYAKANGLTFDPNVGIFMGDDMKAANAALMLEIKSGDRDIPKEYLAAKEEAAKAQAAMDTEFGKLKDKTYEGKVRIGQSPDEEITIIPQRGQRPKPATKGGRAPGQPSTPVAGRLRNPKRNANYMIGDKVKMRGRWYEVTGGDENDWFLDPTTAPEGYK